MADNSRVRRWAPRLLVLVVALLQAQRCTARPAPDSQAPEVVLYADAINSSVALLTLSSDEQREASATACFLLVPDKACLDDSSPGCAGASMIHPRNITFSFESACAQDLQLARWTLDGRQLWTPELDATSGAVMLRGLGGFATPTSPPKDLCLHLPPAGKCNTLRKLCGSAAACDYSLNASRPGGRTVVISGRARTDQTPLSFGWGGTGFKIPYEWGVAHALTALGLLRPRTAPLAGASSGSIVSTAFCFGLNVKEGMAASNVLLDVCSGANRTFCLGRLDAVLTQVLQQALPNGSQWLGCNGGRLSIAINLPLVNYTNPADPANNNQFDAFTSRADIIDAVRASSFLPTISNGTQRTTSMFRGLTTFDGGLASIPEGWVPCPWSQPLDGCIAVHAAVPTNASAALGSERGGGDAADATVAAGALSPIRSAQKRADIHPGKFQPLPFGMNATQWSQLSLVPVPPPMRQAMLEYGTRDALMWAKQEGLLA